MALTENYLKSGHPGPSVKPQEGEPNTPTPPQVDTRHREFQENEVKPLSDTDRDIFLTWMNSDTKPNAALMQAAREFKQEGL